MGEPPCPQGKIPFTEWTAEEKRKFAEWYAAPFNKPSRFLDELEKAKKK